MMFHDIVFDLDHGILGKISYFILFSLGAFEGVNMEANDFGIRFLF
jgi:hypothetical protein